LVTAFLDTWHHTPSLNFIARFSIIMLGRSKENKDWQVLTILISVVLKSFMKNLFITKSSEFSYDSYVLDVSVRACVPRRKLAVYFCLLLLCSVCGVFAVCTACLCVCVSAGCNCWQDLRLLLAATPLLQLLDHCPTPGTTQLPLCLINSSAYRSLSDCRRNRNLIRTVTLNLNVSTLLHDRQYAVHERV